MANERVPDCIESVTCAVWSSALLLCFQALAWVRASKIPPRCIPMMLDPLCRGGSESENIRGKLFRIWYYCLGSSEYSKNNGVPIKKEKRLQKLFPNKRSHQDFLHRNLGGGCMYFKRNNSLHHSDALEKQLGNARAMAELAPPAPPTPHKPSTIQPLPDSSTYAEILNA